MAMFDLPVVTKPERKAATQFRKNLLDDGFLMVQYSVYARPCVTYEQLEQHLCRMKHMIPPAGNVRVMFMTDEQWKKSFTVSGGNYTAAADDPGLQIPKQVEFWE